MFAEADLAPLSALQHLVYCERQCALIHLEQLWADNRFTAEGTLLHERVDQRHHEHRRDHRTEYSMPVHSLVLGLSGICDLVEFQLLPDGGYASVVPVEYKRGTAKVTDEDRVQLCAQTLCLEEMLHIAVPVGEFYYLADHRRTTVDITEELRRETASVTARLHALLEIGQTPKAKYRKSKCDRCSLFDLCLPQMPGFSGSVGEWMEQQMRASRDA